MLTRRLLTSLGSFALFLCACDDAESKAPGFSGDAGSSDAGSSDAGSSDAGSSDAGSSDAAAVPGLKAIGEACSTPAECVAGATCTLRDGGGGGVCRTLCTDDGDAGFTCPLRNGAACSAISVFGCCAGCACGTRQVCE